MANTTRTFSTSSLAALLLWFQLLHADPGTLDNSFNTGTTLGTACCVAAFGVESVALQTNGMLVVGGLFRGFSGDNAVRNFLARVDPAGNLDSTFNANLGTNSTGSISEVLLQADGKIVIGGSFTNINSVTRNRMARLKPDSSLDDSFDPGSGANGGVSAVAMQLDGKFVIGGAFTTWNGTSRVRIARVNDNGSLDDDFDPAAGANNSVLALALQDDGRVIIGGTFTSVNNTNRNRIARLNEDGGLDTSFNPPSGIDDGAGAVRRVLSLVVQPDGRILVGGWFSSVNGLPCTGIVRLNSDGSSDTNFNVTCLHQSGLGGDLGYVNAIALQRDGRIIVGGNFFASGGATNNGIVRLNSDGSLDSNFNPGSGAGYVGSIAIQQDGKYVIGGEFTSFDNIIRYHLARLDGDPLLNLARFGAFLVLSWPTSYTNFVLECSTNLDVTSGWSTNSASPLIVGNQFVVTNLVENGSKFYRLKR